MRWKFKTKLIMLACVVFCVFEFSPLLASATATGSTVDCGSPSLIRDPNSGLCLPPSNPGSPTTVSGVIMRIINIMLSLAFIIDLVYVILGGYKYITSNGNEKKAEEGMKTVRNALIGLAVIILSFVIVTIVAQDAANPFTGITGVQP